MVECTHFRLFRSPKFRLSWRPALGQHLFKPLIDIILDVRILIWWDNFCSGLAVFCLKMCCSCAQSSSSLVFRTGWLLPAGALTLFEALSPFSYPGRFLAPLTPVAPWPRDTCVPAHSSTERVGQAPGNGKTTPGLEEILMPDILSLSHGVLFTNMLHKIKF